MSPPSSQSVYDAQPVHFPHRQRDLLPLPEVKLLGRCDDETSELRSSRSSRRRLLARQHTAELAESAVTALNEMYCGPDGRKCVHAHPSAAQTASLDFLLNEARDLGPPPDDLSCQGALTELLAKHSYSGTPVTVAPFDVDEISLPPAGGRPVDIVQAAGESGRKIVEGLLSKVLPPEQARAKLEAAGLKKAYSDPIFKRKPQVYARFLQDAG